MKCYKTTITGKVQDTSFRSVVVYAGSSDITEFIREIKIRGERRGAVIQDIERQEIPTDIIGINDLPYPFSRVLSDDDIDLGRKLDKGNELLTDPKGDTSVLPDIKGDTSAIKMGIFTLNSKFDTLNSKFDSFIHGQEEHNLRLEKILEKLAER